jgi:mono/diheme cytochrome c family protein
MKKLMRGDLYQLALIGLGIVSVAFFGVFLLRELFPEYKIYQEDYIALEKFRSTYTGEPPPPFKVEVKQIVIEREDNGPATIDRCISCHVALQIPQFSPTKIAYDLNGNIILDKKGNPQHIPNDEYIWAKLDQKVADLTDSKVIEQLKASGNISEVNDRIEQANKLTALKTATVAGHNYDVTKVLSMHPLMGKETRPFEFHPVDEYGCVSCHNGNGRGLTTEKAHGPVIDEQYEIEFMGPKPQFTEIDPRNDPAFSKMFNDKPGHELLFQTNPIFIGSLIQAKCVQCHQSSQTILQDSMNSALSVAEEYQNRSQSIQRSLENEKQALISLLIIKKNIQSNGLTETLDSLQKKSQDYSLPASKIEQYSSQLTFIKKLLPAEINKDGNSKMVIKKIDDEIIKMVGSNTLKNELESENEISYDSLNLFIASHLDNKSAKGSLFEKTAEWNLQQDLIKHIKDTSTSIERTVDDQKFLSSASSDIDFLTQNYHQGQQLYISMGCYACHRIAGFSRGGVGPELTRIGKNYPWYIKESIVWPQADLHTSTMPNQNLDHEELENLMTYLLAQNGVNQSVSNTDQKTALQEWEAGRKLPWEKQITPAQIHDLNYSMTVFATEGCAACHRLKGYESNVGFAIQKDNKPDFSALYHEHEWFQQLFPEEIPGSQIVEILDKNSAEIDKRILNDVRKDGLLEKIEKEFPGVIESFYTPFKFANRAKNADYADLIKKESDPAKKIILKNELAAWKTRVKRVMQMYIQEYGLGRLICPRPNWSGIFRTDEWLMEHFRNPSAHSPKSLMPVMPFDDSKFYALTYMLDVLGIQNRNEVRDIWKHNGFSPELAFQIHCAQCHGENRVGNGPVSEWIYPIPKNLRNADFLRNLTKEEAIKSITHGIHGTPMPPWGEVAADKPEAKGLPVLTKQEISTLVDWLYSSLPGSRVIQGTKDVPKWQYSPEDVLEELKNEGNLLEPESTKKKATEPNSPLSCLPTGKGYYASLNPTVNANEESNVKDIFDIIPDTSAGSNKFNYYIKKNFYTAENIARGKAFFELNCAICHGNEADGSGMRAAFMYDAKPRMLNNLDWINTRDDLRLLRSIKYGVLGTAMTPWGDQTSSLQRLQLVIFIRSLTQDRQKREKLLTTIYKTFETDLLNIEEARIANYVALDKLQKDYEDIQFKQSLLEGKVQQGLETPQAAVENYAKELKLLTDITQKQSIDQIYIDLKTALKREMNLYQNLGLDILAKTDDNEIHQKFLKAISLNIGRYTFKNSQLSQHVNPENDKKIAEISKELVLEFTSIIDKMKQQKIKIEGQLPSPQRSQEIATITAEISTMNKIMQKLISDMEEASRMRNKQVELFKNLEKNNSKSINQQPNGYNEQT